MESIVSDDERDLYSLPIRDGGLGKPILQENASIHYESLKATAAPLVIIMMNQRNVLPNKTLVTKTKSKIVRQSALLQKSKNFNEKLTEQTGRDIAEAREKGVSIWHSVLQLEEFGFFLNKGEYRDFGMLKNCVDSLSKTFVASGTTLIMHYIVNEEDLLNLITQVHHDVEVEPHLQTINGENINGLNGDNARPGLRARSVWQNEQNAFFDITNTNTSANSHHLSPTKILERHEKEKENTNTIIVL